MMDTVDERTCQTKRYANEQEGRKQANAKTTCHLQNVNKHTKQWNQTMGLVPSESP